MTDKQYDNLKPKQAIQIIHPLERGRIVKTYIKHTSLHGERGFIVGSIFYRLCDVKLVTEKVENNE